MQLIFVSDIHASLRLPYAKVDPDGRSSDRLADVISIIDQIREYCAFSGKDAAVFIVGDLFDRQHPDAPTLIATSAALMRLKAVAPVSILPGNHDAVGKDGKMYSLQLFEELRTDGIEILPYGSFELGGVNIHSVPWLPTERARKRISALKQQRDNGYNILLIHQDIVGAKWDSGMLSDEGLDPDETTDGWDLTLSGHYHTPQKFGSCGRYLGSPLDLRFGDEKVQERGFWVFDTETQKFWMEPTKYPRFQTLRIQINGDGDLPTGLPIESGVEYARLICSGPRELLDKIDRKLIDPGIRYFRIEPEPTKRDVERRIDVDPSMDPADMCRRYVRAVKGDDRDLIDVGLRLMGEK